MEYGQASKSDIDFEFDSSDSEGDDVSISTNASSEPPTPLSRIGVRGMVKKLNMATLQQREEDEGHDFLSGIGDDDSEGGSDLSIGSEELLSPRSTRKNGGDKSCRRRHSDEFGPPIVVPLKTGSDHSALDGNNESIEAGSRSSRSSRRSTRSGDFNRRAPVRTKSGEGMTNSTHSAASGRRRPPPRTKSGEGIVKNDEQSVSNHRRRPPPRTKSGNSDGIIRRPPQRTKSGGTLRGSKKEYGGEENGEESIYYEEKLPDDDDSFDEFATPTSPARRHKSTGHEDTEYREMALKRNSARRQRSSDTLGAMRDATRNMPGRSQSGAGITNGRRRGTNRSKSGGLMSMRGHSSEELASPGRKPLRRRAPPRTKSGGTLRAAPPLET